MTDPRFHPKPEPLDLDRLLALTGATLAGDARALAITGVGSLGLGGPFDLALAAGADDAEALRDSDAGACLMTADLARLAPVGMAALVSPDPARAFQAAAAALYPAAVRPQPLFGPGVSAGAVTHPEARLETDVSVDPGAVVGPRAEIGRGSVVGANAVIGADVRIGRDCAIGPGAVIEHAFVGDRVRLEAGARLGQGGPRHLGRVIVQDDVEIGANASVDRGQAGDTIIGERARLGALARIGAGAAVGRLSHVPAGATVAENHEFLDETTVGLDSGRPDEAWTAGPAAPRDTP